MTYEPDDCKEKVDDNWLVTTVLVFEFIDTASLIILIIFTIYNTYNYLYKLRIKQSLILIFYFLTYIICIADLVRVIQSIVHTSQQTVCLFKEFFMFADDMVMLAMISLGWLMIATMDTLTISLDLIIKN